MLSSRLAVCDAPPGANEGVGRERPAARSRHERRSSSIKQWAQVATATLLVTGLPVAIVWWLRGSGAISSVVVCVALGMALSLCASQLGCFLWERRPASEDLLFSELMLWGFLHRRYSEHRLASAHDILGPIGEARDDAPGAASAKRQAKLLERLVAGMETRDPYLHGHSRRVARHSWMIARRMGLPGAEVARIRTAAAIHDVGKVNTPKAILHKPARLTDEEYAVIKRHPGDGGEMASVLGDQELTSIVRHHHERLDGSGYPDALTAESIPLGARIVAVADTFDAMSSARPYRPASPHRRAIDILQAEAGTTLDAAVVRAFCSHYAGRRPIALWAFLAGLPERAVSWLGGSVGSVASAAKMLAVAALVGGTAAATSPLALPAKQSSTGSPEVSAAAALGRPNQALALGLTSGTTASARQRARGRAAGAGLLSRSSSPAQPSIRSVGGVTAAQAPQGSIAGGAGQAAAGAPGKSSAIHGGSETTLGRSETPHSIREVAQGKAGAPHGKSEEAHGKAGVPHGKSEEAHGKAGAPHGKSEEPHGNSEEAHGNSEAPHGKSEEAPGKGETPHGNSEEAPGKSGESSGGKAEEAHGGGEEAHGKSEEAHGHT